MQYFDPWISSCYLSCVFLFRKVFRSTAWFSTDWVRNNLLTSTRQLFVTVRDYSLFAVRCSLFAVRCSLFAVHCSLFVTIRYSLFGYSRHPFTYDFFHMHHSFTYLSREHMNPKLTCSQHQWLHSSVGRASHRYREVTGSSPVEVLNFFQASLRNCKNCDHNCEDHSSFDFISAVHI